MAKKVETHYYQAVGRRKSSVARVRLYVPTAGKDLIVKGKKIKAGDHLINDMTMETYFPSITQQLSYVKPLEIADALKRFAISITVSGGGKEGQLEAVTLGIARALVKVEETFKAPLRGSGLLTRDPRTRERRKPGTGGKSRRQKQSPKR